MAAKKSGEKSNEAVSVAALGPSVGDKAPKFKLENQAGESVSSSFLRGERYVLYFYPKDNTPGCTTEGCDFRDAHGAFEKLGVRVLGVSPDTAAVHGRFAAKHEFPFDLLADTDRQLAEAYETWVLKKNYGREYMGIERSTYVISPSGKVEHVWRKVRVKNHVEQVRLAIAAQ